MLDALEQQVMQLLNDDKRARTVYALTFNARTGKWVVLALDRTDDEGAFRARPYTAGDTPRMALKDAVTLVAGNHQFRVGQGY